MCSILTHPVVPVALSVFLPQGVASPALLLTGAVCSIVPHLDVIDFRFSITYSDLLGHRGLTHSILVAAALGALLSFTFFHNGQGGDWAVFLFLFLSTLSHPLLDMLTNGGVERRPFRAVQQREIFFPWRPIEVSPIGVGSFFSERGGQVIASELRWVWLPSSVVFALGYVARRYG